MGEASRHVFDILVLFGLILDFEYFEWLYNSRAFEAKSTETNNESVSEE